MLNLSIYFKVPLLIIAASGIGVFAWGNIDNPYFMLLSLAVLPLWFHSPNRFVAWLLMLSYFLMASRGLPDGTAVYFGEGVSFGIKVWMIANLWVSLPFLLWFKSEAKRTIGLIAALLLIAVPPFGFTGWAHPLSGTGFFLPSGGFLALIVVLIGVVFSIKKYPWATLIPLFIAGVIPQNLETTTIPNWVAVDTHFKDNYETFDNDFMRQHSIINMLNQKEDNPDVYVLPETIAGTWLGGNDSLWKTSYTRKPSVLLGATVLTHDNRKDSVVMMASEGDNKLLYRQRQPVPFSMWIPFKKGTYKMHLFDGKPTVTIKDKNIAFLICYEQLLMYPMLQSAFYKPDYIIGMSNSWWAANTSIPTIQRNMVYAWSRLFDIPYVYSENI